jgi:putative radical SAM enzyme (TIGR03279 family)
VSKSGHGVIAAVAEGSIAERAGMQPGDQLVSVNGHLLRDVIDYRFYGAEEELEIIVERDGQRIVFQIERGYDEDLGIEFATPTFDGIRRCNSQCAFCFIAGMPKGMRPSLYVRDDDYRYSFLFGNFVTLTNLTEADWQRLAEQRLSPLYVSVHATDLALRRRLLGNPAAPDVMGQLRRLGELGIQLHTQVVLMPGLNDGPALAQTVADLATLHPAVQSIAIVPVGLTRYHRYNLRPHRPDEAGPILDQITAWQREYQEQHNLNLVYASDEWYLLAGHEVPPADEYDGFPQLENGVGLTRVFLDEWEELRSRIQGPTRSSRTFSAAGERETSFATSEEKPSTIKAGRIVLACGTLIAPWLAEIAAELGNLARCRSSRTFSAAGERETSFATPEENPYNVELTGLEVEVIPVANDFFGPTVTVSGLLTGQDVIAALQGRDLGDAVFLPRTMFNAAGEVTLDDMTPLEIRARLGTKVEIAGAMGELVGLLTSVS